MVTPGLIQFAIAFCCYADPLRELGPKYTESLAGQEWIAWLKENCLIDEHLHPTPRLKAWIDHLCDQPLPEARWVVPAPEGTGGKE